MMDKYLNELESDLSELERRIESAKSSYDDVEKELNKKSINTAEQDIFVNKCKHKFFKI